MGGEAERNSLQALIGMRPEDVARRRLERMTLGNLCCAPRRRSVMPEHRQQNDDGQRHAKQPEQCSSSKTHDSLLT